VRDVRYRNARNIGKYSQSVLSGALPTIGSEQLTKEQRMFELIFLTLRSTGIPVSMMLDRFGCDLESILRTHLAWMIKEEYLTMGEHIRLTKKGFLVCDDITLSVVSAVESALGLEWERAEDIDEETNDELQHEKESPNSFVSISMP
jgi:coproporphyrinogen III oxidase-like Fe-S oxidoreductase